MDQHSVCTWYGWSPIINDDYKWWYAFIKQNQHIRNISMFFSTIPYDKMFEIGFYLEEAF